MRESSNSLGVVTIIVGIIVLMIITLPLGCKKKQETKTKAERIINVRAAMVEKISYRPSLEAVGTLAALEEVVASAELDGIVKTVMVDEGGSVKKRMIIAELSDRDYLLETRRAEAALMQAEATQANIALEFERKDALYKEELVTRQQYDDVSTRLALAKAEVERARASHLLAKERQGKTVIVSPVDGVVRERKIQQGNFVRAGTPVFTLIRVDPIKLIFTVPEKEMARIKIGQAVTFQIESLPGREFAGRITLIHPVIEERTRTLKVEAQAANGEKLLKPGLFARVILYTDSPRELLAIPLTAIVSENDKHRLFVVDGNQVRVREVKLGPKIGELAGILSGLTGEETVVVAGHHNLVDGVKVNVAR